MSNSACLHTCRKVRADTDRIGRDDEIKIGTEGGYSRIIANAQLDIRPRINLSGEKLVDQGELIHDLISSVFQRNDLDALSKMALM